MGNTATSATTVPNIEHVLYNIENQPEIQQTEKPFTFAVNNQTMRTFQTVRKLGVAKIDERLDGVYLVNEIGTEEKFAIKVFTNIKATSLSRIRETMDLMKNNGGKISIAKVYESYLWDRVLYMVMVCSYVYI